jgi:hypothetical protein
LYDETFSQPSLHFYNFLAFGDIDTVHISPMFWLERFSEWDVDKLSAPYATKMKYHTRQFQEKVQDLIKNRKNLLKVISQYYSIERNQAESEKEK